MKTNASDNQWSGKLGFVMAAAGSAIGLGNIWKFPYMVGTNGGAVFFSVYIVFLFVLGIPVLMAEMAIGRYAGMNAVDSCGRISEKWKFAGWFGIIGAFTILSYYSVVGGWVIKYILHYIVNGRISDPSAYFAGFSSQTAEPIILHLIFLFICAAIVMGGISSGIEKVSKILLPLLFILLIVMAGVSLSLPNASEGIRYFLVPDFSDVENIGAICLNAMGQVFFSLSLGMGTLITYGSYLPKDSRIISSAGSIVALDSLAAVLSAFVVLPAVFSFGMTPEAGPGLLFQTLPVVFDKISLGRIAAVMFFVLVLLAAVTSAISLMEVVVAFMAERFKMKRSDAVIVLSLILGGVGALSSMSLGVLSDFTIFGMGFFDFLSFLSDKIIMPLGGFFICILVGYVWGIPAAANEISNGGKLKFRSRKLFAAVVRYIAPALILFIFVSALV